MFLSFSYPAAVLPFLKPFNHICNSFLAYKLRATVCYQGTIGLGWKAKVQNF